MNKHILMVVDHQLNPNKYTQEQLEDNRTNAYVDYAYAANSAANAIAYDATADYATAAYAAAYVDYWLDEYFQRTGESKQDYIDEIVRSNSKWVLA